MRIVATNDTQPAAAPPAGDPPDAGVFGIFFEPRTRMNWHTHPEGQILYVLTGTCRVSREGEPPTDIAPGGVVHFAPGERHRHGAGSDTHMVHLAVNPANASNGGADRLEPVTDEQYAGV